VEEGKKKQKETAVDERNGFDGKKKDKKDFIE